MAETDTPPVLTEEGLVPHRAAGSGLLDRWVEIDPEKALKLIEARVRTLEQLRVASIKATFPSDWIINVSRDHDDKVISERGYLQDIGAERAGKIWGIEVGMPAIEREDFPDGSYAYHMVGEAWSKVTGERLDYAEGSRSSGDRFFQRGLAEGEKPDSTDIRKAAYANLHGRAVRSLSGLNGVPIDMLRQAGLDVAKVVIVDYMKGNKGGESSGASIGSGGARMGFGNSQGKAPAELEDKDLAWYIGAYTRNVEDPDPKKVRFKKANQQVLDALIAERDRRAQKAAHEAETGTKAPEAGAGEGQAGPATRGGKLADLNTKLSDACGDRRLVAPVMRIMTAELFGKETANLSDLTDEQIEKLAGVDDKTLAAVVAKAKEAKK